MKKLLLTLAISIIWFIGFSSAVDVSCNYDSEWWLMALKWWWQKRWDDPVVWWNSLTCYPEWIDSIELNDFTISFDFNREGFIGVLEDDLTIYLTDWWKNQIPILYCNQIDEECYNYDITVNTYEDINTSYKWTSLNYKIEYQWFWNFDFDFSYTITDNEENVEEPWTWWNENPPVIPDNPWDWWNSGWLIAWWIDKFTPIINWLKNAIIEFIPYLVYVGVWLISAILWFFAIKWLINWTRRKTLTNFTSRRLRK